MGGKPCIRGLRVTVGTIIGLLAAGRSVEEIVAVHWSTVGDARAADRELLAWAAARDHVVFTHDLDFGALLALTGAAGPSVVQVRGALDLLPAALGGRVVATLEAFEAELARGALVTLDGSLERVRVLPIPRR